MPLARAPGSSNEDAGQSSTACPATRREGAFGRRSARDSDLWRPAYPLRARPVGTAGPEARGRRCDAYWPLCAAAGLLSRRPADAAAHAAAARRNCVPTMAGATTPRIATTTDAFATPIRRVRSASGGPITSTTSSSSSATTTGRACAERGSAVFIHVAGAGLAPTAGCIALRAADLKRLIGRMSRDTVLRVLP